MRLSERETSGVPIAASAEQPEDIDYWHSLIDENETAKFFGVTTRTVQNWRQRGDGPEYIRLGAKLIRYTRIRLKSYADARMRKSTSDPGQAAT